MLKAVVLAPKLKSARAFLLTLVVLLACAPGWSSAGAAPASITRVATLSVPGKPLRNFDIGSVNASGIYAFSDRSNRGLDLFSVGTGKFLGRATGFGKSGPKGVAAVGAEEFWASNGDGTVKVVDVHSRKVVASILTEPGKTTDELTFDPRDHLVAVVSKHDGPPVVNFISTRTRRLVGRVQIPRATDGAEQPVWDPASGLIYLSVPVLDHVDAHGAVAVINPLTHAVVKLIAVEKCMPAGLALGPQDDLLVGCSDDAVAAGMPARSLIINASSGKVVARLPQVGGSDEVWSDEAADRYYLAAVANPGGPVLGVVNSRTRRWIVNVPTGPDAHSVAADARTGKVFVPMAAERSNRVCPRGCVAVYSPH